MKPESSEQIDALWGQNLADDVSAAYHQYLNPFAFVGTHILGDMAALSNTVYGRGVFDTYVDNSGVYTLHFIKKPEYDTLIGSYWGTISSWDNDSNSHAGTAILTVDGGTVHTFGYTIPDENTYIKSEAFSYDISGLTDNVVYGLKADQTGWGASVGGQTLANSKWLIMCTE